MKITADYVKAFKPADIRGVYPREIDEELVYFIARSFVDEYQHKEILVARDMRLSSDALQAAFVKGVLDAGANVIDLGLVHTPVLYFASGTMELPGVVITASHSPRDYNGLKLVLSEAVPLTENGGLKEIRRRLEKGQFKEPTRRGKVIKKDILKVYQRFVLKGLKSKGLDKLKIVADSGNGMAGILLPLLEEKTPLKFTKLFEKLDGRFPNRGSDPTLRQNQRHLAKAVKSGSYDFGIAFDGDADRIAFVDEKGRFINSAAIGALISAYLLKKEPKAKIIYTILTSRIYEETIKALGGRAVQARVGHAFIKEKMRKDDVLFGCEQSGHYYFKDYFYTDSVVMTLRMVLEIYLEAQSRNLAFSDMVKPYTVYEQTEDAVVEVKDKKQSMKLLEAYLLKQNPLRIKKFDGLFVDFGEVWGVVTPSVTEPALKILFEAKNKTLAQSKLRAVVDFAKSIALK